MPTFKLINPYIEGKFNTSITANTSKDAASEFWKNLSVNFTNNVPKFVFSLESSNNDVDHFIVKEKLSESGNINCVLEQLDSSKISKKYLKNFYGQLNEVKNKRSQKGGGETKKKRYQDDDDDDDDDEDLAYYKIHKRISQPIVYWWYNPYLYVDYVRSIFVPTFVVPLTPFIELGLSSAILL